MFNIIENDFFKKCTGCGACQNVCPKNAITLKEDFHTFRYPQINEDKCVHCNKCIVTCPVNNCKSKNPFPKNMYAFKADDEIRKQCSSGGVFPVLANYVIEQGGRVCGAAFDNDMKLRHVIISKKEDLSKLFLSKYLQSDIGNVYKEIETLLKGGKTVLFCGTPCQVAGLGNMLNKEYDNLYCLDILCHGVPSQKIFDLYLNDLSGDKKVVDVNFRNKIFGWTAEHIWVEFDNGSVYTKTRAEGDPYIKAFFENLDLRDSCEDCAFSELPRIGDLTIGDFWGIQKTDSSQNDNKGVSIVLCNSKKGRQLLNVLMQEGKCSEYAFDVKLPNRFNKVFPHSKNKSRFFKLLNHHSFSESVEYIKNDKYDIGLVCNYLASNFGGILTQYALFNVLEDLGYSTLLIERPLDAPEKISEKNVQQIYHKFFFTQCAKRFASKSDMRELNNTCDNFVVGSDVLFRHSLWEKMGKVATLDWVDNTKRKIAYAGSYGYDFLEKNAKNTPEMSYYMQKFDAFSVREESGVKFFKENFGVDATHVLDPVFLCDKRHYDQIVKNSSFKNKTDYICAYLLDPNNDKSLILEYVSKKLSKKVEVFSEFSKAPTELYKKYLNAYEFKELKEEDRLNFIINCDFMIADSFHGICFAIIYNKNFICIVNEARGATRFYSLLKIFGLEDRIVYNFSDVLNNSKLFEPIDYNKVNKILDSQKSRCLKWLKEALEKPISKTYDTYDILQKENIELRKEIETIKKFLKVDYAFENDIFKYIDKLNNAKNNLAIIISAKDTPGLAINSLLSNKLQSLGISTDLKDKHWCGFSSIIYNGVVVDEKCVHDKSVSSVFSDSDVNIHSISSPLHQGNLSSIKINDVEYSMNSRGLNFVVFDTEKGCVTDSVGFDTHMPKYAAVRK